MPWFQKSDFSLNQICLEKEILGNCGVSICLPDAVFALRKEPEQRSMTNPDRGPTLSTPQCRVPQLFREYVCQGLTTLRLSTDTRISLRNIILLQVFLNDLLQYKACFFPVMNQCYKSSFIARNNLPRTHVRPRASIFFENKTTFYNVLDTEQMRGLLHNSQSGSFTCMLCSSHGSPVQHCRVQSLGLAWLWSFPV